jgi:hypothetical protein
MADLAQQTENDSDGNGEHTAAQARDGVADYHERARAQAARVRESLVRCPSSSGSTGA